MIFDYPLLLVLAPLVALALGLIATLARRRRVTRAMAWSPTTGEAARRSGRWSPLLFAIVGLLAMVAVAGPRGGSTNVTTESRALSVAVAMDISRSMLAEDATPSRLQRATREARRLIQDLGGDRIGLLAFAGRSYILSPLTVDGAALMLFLDALSPDLASQGGTGLAGALRQGGELLAASDEAADRVLIVFTDGEGHDTLSDMIAQSRQLKQLGIRLVLVAEGGTKPARIPVRDSTGAITEYQTDDEGHEILTTRRDDILQAISDAAEGSIVPAQLPDQAGAVRDLLSAFARAPSRETRTADLLPLAWIPVAGALLLLGLQTVFRRTAALVALAGVLLAPRAEAQRLSPGERALAGGRSALAADLLLKGLSKGASDTAAYNAGTAALGAGRHDEARLALERASHSLDPELRYRALYNLGVNALAAAKADSAKRDSLYAEAAEHLQEALVLSPKSERAKWNLELAQRHRPPPSGGNSPNQPPPQGGQQPPPPKSGQSGGGERPNLSQSQADEILGSVEREERNTRERQMARNKTNVHAVKDW
ncbi:MAG TPA: VWA domain-containing protein [Gemmatimonadales bacterium]|jgi:Ca-activated chloride channel family protein